MRDDDILIGTLMEDSWLTLDQVAAACRVDAAWLLRHIEEGLFPHTESVAGTWRFSGTSSCVHAGCDNWRRTSMRCRNWRP